MHNFNLTTVPTASQNVTNLSILEESCNNNSYSYWVGATDLYDDGSTNFSGFYTGALTVPPHWVLKNSARCGVGFYVRRHSDWKYGSFDLKVHWSNDVASNNMRLVAKIDTVREGAAIVAGNNVEQTVSVGLADVINTTVLMSPVLRQDSLMSRDKIGMYVHVQRTGNAVEDTNTGAMSIYGIELVYNEVKRVIGDAIKK